MTPEVTAGITYWLEVGATIGLFCLIVACIAELWDA